MLIKQSFEAIQTWKAEFIQQGGVKDPENFPFVILGNKKDRETDREVQFEKASTWCLNNGDHPLFETSAKEDIGVLDAFEKITTLAANQVKEEDLYIPQSVKIDKSKTKKKNGKSGGCS